MERLTFYVLTDVLKRPVMDLLASDEDFYSLALDLANRTDNDAGAIEPDDLEAFYSYLDKRTTYYTAELLYMIQFAMDDVTSL